MRLKAKARDAVYDAVGAAAGVWPGTLAARAFFSQRICIIFYHAVWKAGDPRLALFGGVTADALAAELDRLSETFSFASLAEVFDGGARAGRPRIAVTFDDGFDLIAGGAAELLKARGVKATVFVNTQSCEYRRVLWQHALGMVRALKGEADFLAAFNAAQRRRGLGPDIVAFGSFVPATRNWPRDAFDTITDEIWLDAQMPPMDGVLAEHRPYMDKARLAEWIGLGHQVGFHGKSHLWSSTFSEADYEAEIAAPAAALQRELGLSSPPFAYAFGDRLPGALERRLQASGIVSSALGTDRLSPRGTSPFAADRIEADFGLNRHFFGRAMVRGLRGQDRVAPAERLKPA
jgi:peptidoglycan/xylan/chitin deacetylase (PgdA/CDA1 family)